MSKKKKKNSKVEKIESDIFIEVNDQDNATEGTEQDPLDLLFKDSALQELDYIETKVKITTEGEGPTDLSALSEELTDLLAENLNINLGDEFLLTDSIESESAKDIFEQENSEDILEAEGDESIGESIGEESSEDIFSLESVPMVEDVVQLTDDESISIIESLLFISDRPVGLTTFKNAFDGTSVNTKKIKELLNELKIDFVNARRGVSLEEIDGAYQLRTKADNQDYIKKILKPKIFKLTGPSLETLSVIAYKQPCVKSQVDEVRGVESGHLVRALMDKGLVAFDGKSELPGRPMQYKTTKKFLEIFGLRNLSELPSLSEIEELLPEGIGEDEDKQTLSDLAGKLEESFEASSYSIGEEELGKITEQLSGISTQTEFFEVEKQKQKESRDRDRAEGIREALILGDAVDPKDEKWLQRYEVKMNSDVVVHEDILMEEEDTDTASSSGESKDQEDLESMIVQDPLDLI